MRRKSATRNALVFTVGLLVASSVTSGVAADYAAATPPLSDSRGGDVADALATIHNLASVDDLSPAELHKKLHARVTVQQTSSTTDKGPRWFLSYHIQGEFGKLRAEGLEFRPEQPFDQADQVADATIRFRIDETQACITPDDLQASFSHKLTEPISSLLPSPIDFILQVNARTSVLFGFRRSAFCLDDMIIKQIGIAPPNGRERSEFEFVTPQMKLDRAVSVLLERGFACDTTISRSLELSKDAFTCQMALLANADGFRSETVEVWHDGAAITGVLIVKWQQTP